MNNRWNQFIYKCWAPFYDAFFNNGMFYRARKKVFQDVPFSSEQRILFVGVGTGADLAFIPHEVNVTAIDYSSEMLQKAKNKYKNPSITFHQMDAQQLTFDSFSFDVVVASLILSVVPDAEQALKEMTRVVKPKGTILIFDKFETKKKSAAFPKKIFRPFVKLLGTDIGLSFEHVFEASRDQLILKENSSIMLKGMYRKISLQKVDE
ncbi:class I SAM-dependent methyltransferase [Priestia megaterium]|uniref:class I SAM-dependent methyltransferase n=1 Tax=Priestia megaterium TaxID=1404 RepID=UPI0023646806|nr:class I SAM-dependent methyltransferase [Priestia megaterium]MDD1512206.1 methyltransferase domain-containing protein [Priestia megaterium]